MVELDALECRRRICDQQRTRFDQASARTADGYYPLQRSFKQKCLRATEEPETMVGANVLRTAHRAALYSARMPEARALSTNRPQSGEHYFKPAEHPYVSEVFGADLKIKMDSPEKAIYIPKHASYDPVPFTPSFESAGEGDEWPELFNPMASVMWREDESAKLLRLNGINGSSHPICSQVDTISKLECGHQPASSSTSTSPPSSPPAASYQSWPLTASAALDIVPVKSFITQFCSLLKMATNLIRGYKEVNLRAELFWLRRKLAKKLCSQSWLLAWRVSRQSLEM